MYFSTCNVYLIYIDRVINAVNQSYGSFDFSLAPEGGETVDECSSASFDSYNIGFMDATERGNITVGKYVYIVRTYVLVHLPYSGFFHFYGITISCSRKNFHGLNFFRSYSTAKNVKIAPP